MLERCFEVCVCGGGGGGGGGCKLTALAIARESRLGDSLGLAWAA